MSVLNFDLLKALNSGNYKLSCSSFAVATDFSDCLARGIGRILIKTIFLSFECLGSFI